MKRINLLDCTLRDGGYVNDWEFGHSVITGTYKKLDAAGVDFIEVGFLDDRRSFDVNRSIVPDTRGFDIIMDGVQKKKAIPVAMIDFGTCSIDNIAPCCESFIDGIRVIFKKEKIDQALPFCQAIKDKGYELFIQAISITAYSDMEMLLYIEKINQIKPFAFSIVDTYGLLDKKKLVHYFNLIDNNLDPSIIIGYHSHNNFQLAFSNTMEFLSLNTKRQLIADATIYGMGKSAGNCASELLALHMNQYYEKNYDINQFLEALDADLMPIYQKRYWGYKYNFFISAMQNCHPNYVQYLLDKKTLTISAVNAILSSLPVEKKLHFDKQYIESEYVKYQSLVIDDETELQKLKEEWQNRTILLVGPGQTIVKEKNKLFAILNETKPCVISVNFVPPEIDSDFVFISNAKRYGKMVDSYDVNRSQSRIIITSNVTPFDIPAKYTLNYQSLMDTGALSTDNALLLCLSALIRAGVKQVMLAGFDGFTKGDNYYDPAYSYAGNESYTIHNNQIVMESIKHLSKKIKIVFVTPSIYNSES